MSPKQLALDGGLAAGLVLALAAVFVLDKPGPAPAPEKQQEEQRPTPTPPLVAKDDSDQKKDKDKGDLVLIPAAKPELALVELDPTQPRPLRLAVNQPGWDDVGKVMA